MSPGRLAYEVEGMARADALTARAGLPLVVETRRALGRGAAIAAHGQIRERASGYGEIAKPEALGLLLAAGGECRDAIQTLRADAGLERLLGRALPSAATLRHGAYAFHDAALITAAQQQRPRGKDAHIPAERPALQGLARVNTARVHRVAAPGEGTRAPLDHAATLLESHRRAALPHSKGVLGIGDVAN